MWLWGYEMTMAGHSSDMEMLYMTVLYMAKPGACSNAEGMPSERKVPPHHHHPPLPAAHIGEQGQEPFLEAAPGRRAAGQAEAGKFGFRSGTDNFQTVVSVRSDEPGLFQKEPALNGSSPEPKA